MANEIEIGGSGVSVLYTEDSQESMGGSGVSVLTNLDPALKNLQELGQVELQRPGALKSFQEIVQVELTRRAVGVYNYQLLGQVEYMETPPPTVYRKFPVPHPKTKWQSQADKRKFPVVQ